jgi:hypothetical protein
MDFVPYGFIPHNIIHPDSSSIRPDQFVGGEILKVVYSRLNIPIVLVG